MQSIKKSFARKAVRSTAKHSAHGAASKLKREPLRATSLISLGALVGAVAGWLLGRSGLARAASPAPQEAPA
jgi:membrane protein YqaA with SNARE-associated domain